MSAKVLPGPQRVAVFPLNVVLFPGGLLPLRIFEPRYLRMVSECLKNDEPFAVATIVDGGPETDIAVTAATGTLAKIIDWQQEEDGLLGLLCEGKQLCTIGEAEVEHDRLLRADVVRQKVATPQRLPSDMQWAAALLDELLQQLGEPYTRLADSDPSADHVAARLVEILPLPLEEKRALFDLPDAIQRLQRLAGLIQQLPEE